MSSPWRIGCPKVGTLPEKKIRIDDKKSNSKQKKRFHLVVQNWLLSSASFKMTHNDCWTVCVSFDKQNEFILLGGGVEMVSSSS